MIVMGLDRGMGHARPRLTSHGAQASAAGTLPTFEFMLVGAEMHRT